MLVAYDIGHSDQPAKPVEGGQERGLRLLGVPAVVRKGLRDQRNRLLNRDPMHRPTSHLDHEGRCDGRLDQIHERAAVASIPLRSRRKRASEVTIGVVSGRFPGNCNIPDL